MMRSMAIERISILGVGLMGGSVGLACRSLRGDLRITGYSPRPAELELALERGAIHIAESDPARAVTDADLVLVCTPVGLFGQMMEAIRGSISPRAMVTDVGSTKRSIVKLAAQILPTGARFVGSHPMVGGEKHGMENARADLLAGGLCILSPDESTDADAANQVEAFWQSIKMRTVRMSPDLHDRLTADISHLPHVVAAALVRMQSLQSLAIAGRGFADATRIAAGDPGLWRDILLDNRDYLRQGLLRFSEQIQELLQSLDAGDTAAVQQWLKTASDLRTGEAIGIRGA